jgi:hypothetical protein
MSKEIEHLLNMQDALGSILSTERKKERKRNVTKEVDEN